MPSYSLLLEGNCKIENVANTEVEDYIFFSIFSTFNLLYYDFRGFWKLLLLPAARIRVNLYWSSALFTQIIVAPFIRLDVYKIFSGFVCRSLDYREKQMD